MYASWRLRKGYRISDRVRIPDIETHHFDNLSTERIGNQVLFQHSILSKLQQSRKDFRSRYFVAVRNSAQCAPRPARGWIPCGAGKSQKQASRFFPARTEIFGRPAHRDGSSFRWFMEWENIVLFAGNVNFLAEIHILREREGR